MSEKQENKLKSKLVAQAAIDLPGFVVQIHQQIRHSGTPDLTFTGNRLTSWVECKHGTPDFDSKGIQELTMLRLAAAGVAFYVIWREDAYGAARETLIVNPANIGSLVPIDACAGFDHGFVTNYIRGLHSV